MVKRSYIKTVKIIISLLLVWLILEKVDLRTLLETIKSIDKILLLFVLILTSLCNLLLSPYKWKNILRAYQIDIPLLKLSTFYLVGMFFNMFMPGITGGDLIKGYDVSKLSQRGIESYVSIFIDRFSGVFGMFANIFIALLFSYRLVDFRIIYAMLISLLFLLFITWLLYNRELVKRMSFLHWLGNKLKLEKKIRELYEAIYLYKDKKKLVSYVFFLSFLFHFGVVTINYIIATALGIKASFIYFWLFIPMIHLIAMIPISINGIGVRDISYVTCFKQAGIPISAAFSISLIAFGVVILLSLIGGIVYAFRE